MYLKPLHSVNELKKSIVKDGYWPFEEGEEDESEEESSEEELSQRDKVIAEVLSKYTSRIM